MRHRSFGRLGWSVSDSRLRHVGHGRLDRLRRRRVAGVPGPGRRARLQLLRHGVRLRRRPQRTAARADAARGTRDGGSTSRPRSRRRTATGPACRRRRSAEVFPYDHVVEMTEQSAANLGVERIDLQQLHVWSDAWVDDDGWKRAAEDLKRRGLDRGLRHQRQPLGAGERTEGARRPASSTACRSSTTSSTRLPRTCSSPRASRRASAVIARVPFDEGSLTGTLPLDSRGRQGDWRNLYFTPERLRETLARVESASAARAARRAPCPTWRCASSSTTRPSRPPSRGCGEPRTWRPTSRPGTRRRFRRSCWKACGRTDGSATGACPSRLRLALLETVE